MTQGWSWVFIFLTLFRASSELAGQTRSAEIQRRYQLAREALAQHDLQRASQEYAEILKLDPRNAEIYAALGMTLYGMGKPAEAVAALGAALNLDGTQTTAELFLGLSRSDLGQCAEAIPRYCQLGVVRVRLGRFVADLRIDQAQVTSCQTSKERDRKRRWLTDRSRWRPIRKRFWITPCTDQNRCT